MIVIAILFLSSILTFFLLLKLNKKKKKKKEKNKINEKQINSNITSEVMKKESNFTITKMLIDNIEYDKFLVKWYGENICPGDLLIIDIFEDEMFFQSLRVCAMEKEKLISGLSRNTEYHVKLRTQGYKDIFSKTVKTTQQDYISFHIDKVGNDNCDLSWDFLQHLDNLQLLFEVYECENFDIKSKFILYTERKIINQKYLRIHSLKPDTQYVIDITIPIIEKKLSQVFTTTS